MALDDSVSYQNALPAKKDPVVPKKETSDQEGPPKVVLVLIAFVGFFFLGALVYVRCK